jgi:hypothetical protein
LLVHNANALFCASTHADGERFDTRDVLARHKRLVHTRPEDREPPKKRGRPPKSSYANAAANQAKKENPAFVENNTSTDTNWPLLDGSNGQTTFQFPKLEGELNNSFLSNPFNDNFGFGPLDTLSEFNFAEQDILSFLNPSQSRNIRDFAFDQIPPLAIDHKPVVLQPDFVDWLQMNRNDYSFSIQHSSPRGLEVSTSPEDLVEAKDGKEDLINPPQPTSVQIDEQTYASILESLKTDYKVCWFYDVLIQNNLLSEFVLPTRRALERFLSLFFDCFHPHFPIIHISSFHPGKIKGMTSIYSY